MTDDPAAHDPDIVLSLQQDLRPELKQPLGSIYTDTEALLADADEVLIAVGDIVTYHLTTAGRLPDVALVDGRTNRSAVEDHVEEAIDTDAFDDCHHVTNPSATLSAGLLEALRDGLTAAADGASTVIVVDGEEDLAALPAVAAGPTGASVVYGQPDEGMVLVTCDEESVAKARDLLGRMDGDTDRLWAILA